MRATWQYIVLLVVVVVVLFAPSIRNGFLFEDRVVLDQLPAREEVGLASFGKVSDEGLWNPLLWASLSMQQRALDGHDPIPYRLVNMLLLTLLGLTFYGLLRQPAMGCRRMPAFLAALVLVVHPVSASAVYHLVDGREILLGLLFMLLSLWFYLRGGWGAALAAAVSYALALAASEQAAWLPLALAAAEGTGLAGWKGHESDTGQPGVTHLKVVRQPSASKRQWPRLLPVLAVFAGYWAWRIHLPGLSILNPAIPDRNPLLEWLYGWYALGVPHREIIVRPAPEFWVSTLSVLAAVLVMALVAAGVMLALRLPGATPPDRRREELRRVLVWVALMVVTFPALTGLINGRIPYDEIRQLPFLLSIIGLMAWALSRLWNYPLFSRQALVVVAGLAVVLGSVSLGRRYAYESEDVFAAHWSRMDPRAWEPFARRAEAWLEMGRTAAADRQAERGLRLSPDEPSLMGVRERIQEKSGKLDEAMNTLDRMILRDPTNQLLRVKREKLETSLKKAPGS